VEIITANGLADGRVVFQTGAGWSHEIAAADLLETKEAVAAALDRAGRDALANVVVEPYAIEVKREAGSLAPLRLRERIRMAGPTTGNSIASADTGADGST
jgi:hypothetical protein